MDIKKLEDAGFNKNEAKVYLALLNTGASQAGKISKESQINRTTIYDTLERLIEKGLVTFVVEANKKVFSPVSPRQILDRLKQTEKSFQEILPELSTTFEESKDREESSLFKGRKGIRSILQDILNCKEYVAFGSSGKFLEVMKHDFELFQKQKRISNIKARVILSESSRNTEQVRSAYARFKYIPNQFSSPTTTFVYSQKTAIIIWGDTPIATLISSKEVANSYKRYFDLLWKKAAL